MADAVAEQIAALKDEDWAIREEAATTLGTLRDPRAVVPLVSVLRDGDRAVRDAAIGALLAIGEPAVTTLGACLSDPVLTVQELASSVLATIADARVLAPLVKALGSPDWIVRMHAAKALGRIKDSGAVAPLVPLLQDSVKAVREETSTALAAMGEEALSSLLVALTHAEWLVRLHAVEALGKTRSSEAVAPLLSVLFNDRDRAVREDAVRALGQIVEQYRQQWVDSLRRPRFPQGFYRMQPHQPFRMGQGAEQRRQRCLPDGGEGCRCLLAHRFYLIL